MRVISRVVEEGLERTVMWDDQEDRREGGRAQRKLLSISYIFRYMTAEGDGRVI